MLGCITGGYYRGVEKTGLHCICFIAQRSILQHAGRNEEKIRINEQALERS